MSTFERWASVLCLSDRSQRALSEAIRDWRFEVRKAETTMERCVVHARACASIARALAYAGLREVAGELRPAAVVRLIAIPMVLVAAIWVYSAMLAPYRRQMLPLTWVLAMLALLWPVGAYWAALLEGPRRRPTLALFLLTSCLIAASVPAWAYEAHAGARGLFAMWAIGTAWTGSMLLVATRASLEPHRRTLGALAFVVPLLACGGLASVRLAVAIWLFGHGQTVNFGWTLPVCTLLTWWAIVRRPESRSEVVQ